MTDISRCENYPVFSCSRRDQRIRQSKAVRQSMVLHKSGGKMADRLIDNNHSEIVIVQKMPY